MYSPIQSVRVKGAAGDPLPAVFQSFSQHGIRFLRGQFCLICAGGGCGKSLLALTYAIKSRVPTLYISADSDPFVQSSRLLSIVTGWPIDKSKSAVRSMRRGSDVEKLMDVPILFTYDAAPTLGRIEDVLHAYLERFDHYPPLIVVDNITNVRSGVEDENPFSGLEFLADELHKLARHTSACVIGLHHVTGGYNDADKPVPISGVKGQVSRVPEMILTLHKTKSEFGPDRLRVSAVKNRTGAADPTGYTFAELEFDGDRMRIADIGCP